MYTLIYKNEIQGNMSKIKEFDSLEVMNGFIKYFSGAITVIDKYETGSRFK